MTQIPELWSLPLFGNVTDVDPISTHKSYSRLADIYGEVFAFYMASDHTIVVNSYDVYNDTCDEKRFEKRTPGALHESRNFLGDGLFTAQSGAEDWAIAHRILMPKFGPLAVRSMFDEMHDIASQLVSKWARQGPEQVIDPTTDFTKLTLDSITMCAMDIRFNSFYRNEHHPFVKAMGEGLLESGQRAFRPSFMNDYVYRGANKKYWENIEVMRATARQAITERRNHPSEKKDLLNAMLLGKDPKTGKGMSEENIIQNCITFLVAGHETTSGLLSFLSVMLLRNPEALQTAQREVDTVIGKDTITVDHVSKLPYITACIRETLRLWPTAPGTRVGPVSRNDSDFPLHVGKKGYKVYKDDVLHTNFLKIHRDPLIYGPDAEIFKPERMLDDNFEKLPPNAWKPFGNGMRACIGRSFALQEAHIAMAMILQNFNLQAVDPSYVMKLNQTLTIKPADFQMRASLREGLTATALERRLWGGKPAKEDHAKDKRVEEKSKIAKSPMTILFGSNAGTCEALATSLARAASGHGYNPKVMALDAATGNVPKDQPLIMITSSYEGEPPDNACQFVQWLKGLQDKDLQGVRYAVFGCGNHDWTNTFHKIPKFVDDIFEQHGATRLAEKGLSDVASSNVFDDFDKWLDTKMWTGVAQNFATEITEKPEHHELDVEIQKTSRSNDLRQDVDEAVVKKVESLTAPGEPEKRHIELELPNHMTYTAGDYLAVLPLNPTKLVKDILTRFGLAWDTVLLIKPGQYTSLPTGRRIPATNLLSAYVELNEPITQKQLSTLTHCTTDPTTRTSLSKLTPTEITNNRISIHALLTQNPSIHLPFPLYLSMLPPLRVRQYSISSSPLHAPHTCTLTYSVLSTPSYANPGHRHLGTASNYLAELKPNDHVHVSVRPSHPNFHLPLDVEHTPVIMICAGTGLAPFRAFVHQRFLQIAAGRALAPAILFIGCRHPELDKLYAKDLTAWSQAGAVDIRYAFSQQPEESEGCRYVQERVWHDRGDLRQLWGMRAKVFVCGNGKLGEGVRGVMVQGWVEGHEGMGVGRREGEEWFEGVRRERFVSDVFE
ncbi:hypothetical protein ACLMJK_009532 [Lecanora helva]